MTEWLLKNKALVLILMFLLVVGGIMVAPFNWHTGLPRSPVAVDAIPNLGENQQIVFAEWPGRSPQDVEDQLGYPLSVALMGVPGVKDVRSQAMFGFVSIAVVFDESVDFYWARSRLLEKLAGLSSDTLPDGVQPMLGPDATGLGQIYWYTLEGRNRDGKPTGGWDLDEIRSVQDWYVRYGLLAAEGISEVASIGGYVREYQIDVNPDTMRLHDVSLAEVVQAVRDANLDVGARTTEINRVEYLVRGVGFIRSLEDIEQAVVRMGENNIPIRVGDLAHVTFGPGERRGVLDVAGGEAVGGVVTVRQNHNPLAAINAVKSRIDEISQGLPRRALIDWSETDWQRVNAFAEAHDLPRWQSATLQHNDSSQQVWRQWLLDNPPKQWPSWLDESRLTIVPFYDRSELIQQNLGTLNEALQQQLLITAAVILLLLLHLRTALVVTLMLPLAVLLTFIAMRLLGVEANIVALAGIAIAIGTIVDMGVIVSDNILRHHRKYPNKPLTELISDATGEVSKAVLTAIATTVISFLPVFTMTGAEGKLFTPLAYTKTLVLLSAVVLALVVVPVLMRIMLGGKTQKLDQWLESHSKTYYLLYALVAIPVLVMLSGLWEPLGPAAGRWRNLVFVLLLFVLVLGTVSVILHYYQAMLGWCLRRKKTFLLMPALVVATGLAIVPTLGREFMPALDEGAFLYMPSTMQHASIGEVLEVISRQGQEIAAIPEVASVVGKAGRAETALDPAPLSMIETIINYKSEYKSDENGKRLNFRVLDNGEFARDENGDLIEDRRGLPYRQWRDHIRSPDDIWQEIIAAADMPGVTSASKLQPIETRQLMLQTGMRANMGIKLQAASLESLEKMAQMFEATLREAPGINPATVNAERVAGKPYLEIHLNRENMARYGLSTRAVQDIISAAIGGAEVSRSVEGRERYPIRVRYTREQRNAIEAMENILVRTADGGHIPLAEFAQIQYQRGPQMIRTENTFLTAYVTFGAEQGLAEVDAVEKARAYLQQVIDKGDLQLDPGFSYQFDGSYRQQQSAMQTLMLIVPLALLLILVILYLQFSGFGIAMMVFSAIAVAWSGGFIMLYLYGQSWFANFAIPFVTQGVSLREIMQFDVTHLSVAVWVGFLALFGIAVDDGLVMAAYLKQRFDEGTPDSIKAIRERTIEAGLQRVRPCLITSATTILALFPVLTATGRGAELMIPMAIPTVGGLTFVVLSMFMVPVLYCWREERRLRSASSIN